MKKFNPIESEILFLDLLKEAMRDVALRGFGEESFGDTDLVGKTQAVVGEEYKVSDLTFESIPQRMVADKALELHRKIGGKGFDEKTEEGRTAIVDTIHMPTYKAIRGKDFTKREKYIKNLAKRPWSSWFLNAPYVLTNGPAKQFIVKWGLRFEDSGCCYPNPLASENRNLVLNDPNRYVGKTLLMIFSKDEIRNNPDLSLVPGDASIVGQGKIKPWEDIRTEFKNKSGGSHMNIFVGGSKFVGGNLSDTTKDSVNDTNAEGFMKLVRVSGLKNA